MNSSLRDVLLRTEKFTEAKGVFFQAGLPHPSKFEVSYLQLRRLEGRVYTDEELSKLPLVPKTHPLAEEWQVRSRTARHLADHLKTRQIETLVEIGCGNGWLLHYLQKSLGADCCGIDVNETELTQAARAFGANSRLTFLFAEIDTVPLNSPVADVIVLASCIQYFPHLAPLVVRLLRLLRPKGEIHLVDSPLYHTRYLPVARERSRHYFAQMNGRDMSEHYHHHAWTELKDFNFQVMYNPEAMHNKLLRKVSARSPFPWIKIVA